MQNSVNHAPGLKCKVCPRLLSEVIKWLVHLGTGAVRKSTLSGRRGCHRIFCGLYVTKRTRICSYPPHPTFPRKGGKA